MKLFNVFNSLITEHYDSEKLYNRELMVKKLNMKNQKGFFIAPKEIRSYIQSLPHIDCVDSEGNKQICTKIPEVMYVYLSGRY
jgi:5-formaminoimidazole-4-carboxamide-1-beta-D-ribofuranosyl 5'-monophosphate synthetase